MVVDSILGRRLDVSLHQSLLMSQGSWMIFLKNPNFRSSACSGIFSLLQSTPHVNTVENVEKEARERNKPVKRKEKHTMEKTMLGLVTIS